MGTAPIGRMLDDDDDDPQPDFVTVLGYWYHTCPKTGFQRRIGHNYKVVVDGKSPPFATCYLCGAPNPALKDKRNWKYGSFQAMVDGEARAKVTKST